MFLPTSCPFFDTPTLWNVLQLFESAFTCEGLPSLKSRARRVDFDGRRWEANGSTTLTDGLATSRRLARPSEHPSTSDSSDVDSASGRRTRIPDVRRPSLFGKKRVRLVPCMVTCSVTSVAKAMVVREKQAIWDQWWVAGILFGSNSPNGSRSRKSREVGFWFPVGKVERWVVPK